MSEQPRDEHGRWTTANGGSTPEVSAANIASVTEKLSGSSRLNMRDAATKGLGSHTRVEVTKFKGQEIDFYSRKTGDKISGKITTLRNTQYGIKANKSDGGALHIFHYMPGP